MFTLANLLIQQIFRSLSHGRHAHGIINDMLQTVLGYFSPSFLSFTSRKSSLSLSMSLSQPPSSVLQLNNLYSDFAEALNTCSIAEASHSVTGHGGCILNRWTAREALDTSLVNAFILMMLRSLALKKLKKIFLSFRFYGYKFVILFTTYRIFSFWSDCQEKDGLKKSLCLFCIRSFTVWEKVHCYEGTFLYFLQLQCI